MAQAFIEKAGDIMRSQGWTEQERKPNGVDHGADDAGTLFDAMYSGRQQSYANAALRG